MIIRKYGLTLRRLKREHLELVRQKRNSESIRQHMFYQKIITSEEQVAWFEANFNAASYYFLIEYKGDAIGVISGKNVDYETKTSHGGIFVWDERYWNSFVPVMATVVMADMTFLKLGFEKTYAEVRSDNQQQLHYNRMLGYEEVDSSSDDMKRLMVLTRENYLEAGQRIRKAVQQIGKDPTPIDWPDFDFSEVTEEEREKHYSNHPPELQRIFDDQFEAVKGRKS